MIRESDWLRTFVPKTCHERFGLARGEIVERRSVPNESLYGRRADYLLTHVEFLCVISVWSVASWA